MLGILCARPKPWILATLSFVHCAATQQHLHLHHHYYHQLFTASTQFTVVRNDHRRPHRSGACRQDSSVGGAASIWHAILPSGGDRRSFLRPALIHDQKGEGSWNVAWDARPARWLHRTDSAWLLFGVCACLAPLYYNFDADNDVVDVDDKIEGHSPVNEISDENNNSSADYRVTGVPADGRCLFRAIAHSASLRSGEEAPDENRQRELADDLRTQVVNELLKRREEIEWFIEGNFDAYVKRIQQPYVWGGEPELIMASHVLKTPISVFMRDRSSGDLMNIANYGKEYRPGNESPINVLFHGYGHYDILETSSKTIVASN